MIMSHWRGGDRGQMLLYEVMVGAPMLTAKAGMSTPIGVGGALTPLGGGPHNDAVFGAVLVRLLR